jgi:signal transduction histidine kinase
MKILSKDQTEELKPKQHPKQNIKASRDVTVNVISAANSNKSTSLTKTQLKEMRQSRQKKNKQRTAEEKKALRLQHIEAERLRREALKRKKKRLKKSVKRNKSAQKSTAPDKKASKTAIKTKEPSHFQSQIEKITSLLRFNITFKLTLGYAFRLVLMLGFIMVLIYTSFSYYLFYTAENTLQYDVTYIETILSTEEGIENPLLPPYLEQGHLKLFLYDHSGLPYYSNLPSSVPDLVSFDEPVTFTPSNFPMLPEPFIRQQENLLDEASTLVLVHDMTFASATLETTFPIAIVFAIVLILSSIRAASRMANKHLRPIHYMTEQVKEMSGNNLSTRLNVSGTKDELKDLSLTFNQMLDDIQKSYEREKQFVSDASHELRTPIAVIKGYAGMLNRWGKDDPAILEESITAILGETENMHSLVESLLFIARNDKGTLQMNMVTFNLSDLMCEIVKETKLIDSQHHIETSITPDLMLYGSVDKLKQAIRIFIDNSIKYTPEDGHISIVLSHDGEMPSLKISDNGIGISKEDLPHIFDRFYRADKSRTKLKASQQHGGTGLGLSIAKIIIEQHGGKIKVDSDLNQGTTFLLKLPSANVTLPPSPIPSETSSETT